MKSSMKMFEKAMSLVAVASMAMACGNNNGVRTTTAARIAIDSPTEAQFQLEAPTQPNRPQLQASRLTLRNDGDAGSTLTLTEFEWLAKPDRLFIEKSSSDVSSCGECSELVCSPTSSGGTCVKTGVPTEAVDIDSGLSTEFRFYITEGSDEVVCPEKPAGLELPENVLADRFCGALRFKHNAISTSNSELGDAVVSASEDSGGGTATIFFVNDGKSGRIDLTDSFLEFEGVAPGGSYMRQFSVINQGRGPLEIDGVRLGSNNQLFMIGGPSQTTIDPGASQQYTLQLVIPQATDPAALEFDTQLIIDSTAVNGSDGQILISVTKDTGPVPTISATCDKLRFDGEPSQDFEVTNVGGATLQITGITYEPRAISSFYSVQIDGEDFSGSESIPTFLEANPERNKRTVTVNFERPDGDEDAPAVGTMLISHNDQGSGRVTRCVLLGDAGDVPVAELIPNTFSLSTENGDQFRSFAIIHRGTAPLTIDSAMLAPTVGGVEEFDLTPSPFMVTVQPDEIFEAQLAYLISDSTEDIVNLTFMSNFMSPSNDFFISVFTRSSVRPLPMITLNTSFATAAKVGEVTSFDIAGSEPASGLSSARWTLLAKPAGSKAYVNSIGERASFVPDVAGSYKIAVTLADEVDNQEILEFTAEN